ncbi:OmpH family outer membrane protein [Roseovarius sp. 2305UL8-3]|uniref:OmpH family outer membrane protein n=1 Tax=Roseovarius conchicola TaxID=3121636 RepID=UPI003528D865
MRQAAIGILASALMAAAVPGPLQAQDVGVVQSEILVLDPDRLFTETQFGQRLNTEYLKQRDVIIARNRQLETELEAEEQALTDMRAEKTPEEFKALADAFDEKVQEIRRDSDRTVRDLELSRERAPVIFMRTVEPILGQLMQDANGVVVLDVRSVLLRSNVVDITDVAISRIDQQIGTGPSNQNAPTPEPSDPDQSTPDASPEQ